MLWKHKTVKVVDLLGNPKPKVLKWEKRKYSQGSRYVPVEVHATASQPGPRKRAGRPQEVENNDTLQGETAPHPMDIDKTFWVEEPVVPTSGKMVQQHVCPSLANLTYLLVLSHLH